MDFSYHFHTLLPPFPTIFTPPEPPFRFDRYPVSLGKYENREQWTESEERVKSARREPKITSPESKIGGVFPKGRRPSSIGLLPGNGPKFSQTVQFRPISSSRFLAYPCCWRKRARSCGFGRGHYLTDPVRRMSNKGVEAAVYSLKKRLISKAHLFGLFENL